MFPEALAERQRRRFVTLACGVVAAVLVAAFVYLLGASERSRLENLPLPLRSKIYAQSLSAIQTVCSKAEDDALASYCSAQAEVLRSLPECDADCRVACLRFLPQPTK